jgi:hypothetical protein
MHHKLALPEQKLIKNTDKRGAGRMWESIRTAVQLAGMVMHDANKVVATLRGGCDTVVVHGHHHAAFWGEVNDDQDGGILQIVSAPSTSLGVEFFTASPEVSNVNCHGAHGRSFEILTIETTARGLRLAAPPSRCQF